MVVRVAPPVTLDERRQEAELHYENYYARFGTHDFTKWNEHIMTRTRLVAVPPYCARFDEYLGVMIGSANDIVFRLNDIFHNPDQTDLLYIENTLHSIDKFIGSDVLYKCTKGSGQYIIQALYRANISLVYNWLSEKGYSPANKYPIKEVAVVEPSVFEHTPHNHSSVSPSKLFLNGFTVEKFTQMLTALGILTSSGGLSIDSKPRNWRAVIECLRENKYLVYGANTTLFNFIQEHYKYPYKLRAIQNPYSSKNIDTQFIYERAREWCASMK